MIWVFGDCELDDALYELRRRGRAVAIEPKVFDVLRHLLRHRQRVVSKTEILDALWPGEVVSDSVLPRCIAAARRALRDSRSRQRVIQTVHGRGYRFVAEVRERSADEEPSANGSLQGGPSATRAQEPPASGGFVGRKAALTRLRAALAEARAGHARLVLLVGEPGIGKSRTADEVRAEAVRAGLRSLAGRCYEGEGAPPFWPWLQVLRGLLTSGELDALAPGFGELGPRNAPGFEGEQLRFRLFEEIARTLRSKADEAPLLVTLDDLHGADPDSLRLLRFLAGELRGARILLLASYRDVEVRRDHPLRALLGDLAREPHCERIALRGLDSGEVAALIETLTGVVPRPALAEAVCAMTEGNPFFVRELVALLAEEGRLDDETAAEGLTLPQGVRDAVGRRLDSLSLECNDVLRACAVIGRDFETPLLERVVETRGEPLLELLGEAEAAGILSESPDRPGGYAFTHALIRQTLYEELRGPRRLALHRSLAEALAALHGAHPEAPAAEIAHHYYEAMPAGTAEEAVAWCVRAAEASHAQLAYDEAARHYERAVEAADFASAPDPARRCELRIAWGEALRTSGEREAGRKRLAHAARLARDLGRSDLLARAAIGYRGFGEMGVPPEADTLALLEEARDALGETQPLLRAQILARLTGTPPYSERMESRARLSAEAWALACEREDPAALTDALSARYWAALGPDRIEERLATAREARALADRLNDRRLLLLAHEIEVGAYLLLGDREGSDAALDAYTNLARELRQPFFLFLASTMRASRAMNRGRFEEAEAEIRRAREVGRGTVAFAEALILGQVFWLMQLKGEFERVAQAVVELQDRFRGSLSSVGALTDMFAARALAGRGDREGARRLLDGIAARGFDGMERDEHWFLEMGVLSELATELGDAGHGKALYRLLLPYAERFVSHDLLRTVAGSVESTLGVLARLGERTEDAIAHFERAIAREEAAGALPALYRTQARLAGALEARGGKGDAGRAASLRAASAAGVRALGVPPPDRTAEPQTP
jgi:DNA-binding winged helix-turn-helix (wHTH) protein